MKQIQYQLIHVPSGAFMGLVVDKTEDGFLVVRRGNSTFLMDVKGPKASEYRVDAVKAWGAK